MNKKERRFINNLVVLVMGTKPDEIRKSDCACGTMMAAWSDEVCIYDEPFFFLARVTVRSVAAVAYRCAMFLPC